MREETFMETHFEMELETSLFEMSSGHPGSWGFHRPLESPFHSFPPPWLPSLSSFFSVTGERALMQDLD